MKEPIESDPELAALTAIWGERGVRPSSLEAESDGRLVASERRLSLSGELSMDAEIYPELAQEPLVVREELGHGGMGVVYVGDQLALRREVAIKRPTSHGSHHAYAGLLKEAWVGAHLAHPNVVPVHALAEIEGRPAIVLKRITGDRWRELLQDPAKIPAADRSDPLGFHLRILLSVCDAIALAHSRGVLHLDLKPDNVMVGTFGEVYVLDWGLAAGVGEDAPPWLPHARSLSAIAGTPEYLAPELAMGAGERIDARTDVYLLGATLHEIVTGAPPHVGESIAVKLFHAYKSPPPELPSDVPQELAAILARAMSRDREARFDDVDALRAAIEAFIAHREADAFVVEARARLASLDEVLASDRRGEAAVWRAFGAARFALREARAGWGEHPDIAPLSAQLFERMAEWAIDSGRLDLATSYLAELATKNDRLAAMLDEARDARAARAARERALEELARAQDLERDSTFRRRIAIALGAIFLFTNLSMAATDRYVFSLGYREALALGALCLVPGVAYAWARRAVLFGNRANAALWSACIATFFLVEAFWIGAASLDVPFRSALALTPLFYLLAFGALTVLLSPRFFLSPAIQVPTVLFATSFPDYAYEIIGVGGALSAALVGLAWRGEQPPNTQGHP